MINEIYYPPDKSKLPKRMYKQSKDKEEFPYTYSIDSDNGYLDYEVENDAGNLDDSMLHGNHPPKKPKIIDRNVLDSKQKYRALIFRENFTHQTEKHGRSKCTCPVECRSAEYFFHRLMPKIDKNC